MTIVRHDAMAGLWDAAVELADSIPEDQWGRDVPWCPAWTVGDLVSHLAGLQAWLNSDPDWAPASAPDSPFDHTVAGLVDARREWPPEQRVDELRAAAADHVAQLKGTADWVAATQGPVGATTRDGLFRIRCFDVWVHLQDLREALGRAVDLDDRSDGAAVAHGYVLGLVPWMFVKRAGASDGAAMRVTLGPPLDHDSVLKVVDRRATWDPTADPGECVVGGSPAALTLLTSGRGSPQRWRDAGALRWRGARAEEFVQRARMFSV